MVAAENHALNNEYASNNEALRISSYHFVTHVNTSVTSRRRPSTWRHKKLSTAWKVSFVAVTCTSIFGLPALVSGFIFVPIGGMRTTRIVLCCFGGKRCEMVATYRESSALP